MAELRSQLRAASVRSETQEVQRALERTEKERLRLGLQVEVCIKGSTGKVEEGSHVVPKQR